MKVKIPKINEEAQEIEDKQSIVLIGANGSGKTRMSIWIEENNKDIPTHRISAQKSLNMPLMVSPTELKIAEEKFLYGTTDDNKIWLKGAGKKNNRWKNKPETHLLNDFNMLMEFLMTENYQKSIEYRELHKNGNVDFDNETRLEKIKSIWENIITHRKLKICAGKIEVTDSETEENSKYYNGSEMSDGERAIFYFIGEALSIPPDSLVIVDEPENHLHKSILVRLWNSIETARKDCTFLYITHSLEFASSRINTQILWVKCLSSDSQWNYELIEDVRASDDLMLEIFGNRQDVLLVEGNHSKSIDRKLYAKLFPKYNVVPVESCNSVIQYTKAYQGLKDMHYVDVKGIIDRDRRSNEEIASYNENNIFVPDVAEIENLFLLPEVIKVVCKKQDKEDTGIIKSVKDKTFEFLKKEVESQALLFSKQKCQNEVYRIVNSKVDSISDYKNRISSIKDAVNIDEIHSSYLEEINKIIDERDFLSALKIFNNKGLLPYTQLSNYFGWKKDYYIDYVLGLLNIDDELSANLKEAFKTYIKLDV
jgi:ABC-type cobalamin/Fe3+-siderophores transport system ATPase subunit